jgi:hypothetical protein
MCCRGRTTRSIAACLCLLVAVAPAVAASQVRCPDGRPCPHSIPLVKPDDHACCAPRPQHCDPTPRPAHCSEVRLAPAPIAAGRNDAPIPTHDFAVAAPRHWSALSVRALAGVASRPADLPPPNHLGLRTASPRAPPTAG